MYIFDNQDLYQIFFLNLNIVQIFHCVEQCRLFHKLPRLVVVVPAKLLDIQFNIWAHDSHAHQFWSLNRAILDRGTDNSWDHNGIQDFLRSDPEESNETFEPKFPTPINFYPKTADPRFSENRAILDRCTDNSWDHYGIQNFLGSDLTY